jgi:AraC family transcriptional regulator, regulatory protein of adaptative response / methylated-DNA-[protein]-cysteine methyltransferase
MMLAPSDPAVIIADPRFAQLRARDREADGRFVYSVRTTGVYCRPSCAARSARPENIAFHDTASDAEAAGFRACKRCKPNTVGSPKSERMQAIADHICAHPDEALSLSKLAAMAELSPTHFQRAFKAVLGVSPRELQADARLRRFKAELRGGDGVLGATFGAGYGSTSRVYERVDAGLGMTPGAYRNGGRGETLTYAIRSTALGPLMMAATTRGVAFVEFGNDATELVTSLRREFPHASVELASAEADAQLADWIAALNAHLSHGAPSPDLPLDLRGTAFQVKVWRFLLSVKQGDVISYSELAAGVGAPKAVRAAASACAANRIGVLIPCHRALRADGGLGGYRWGLERKRALLGAERRAARA